MSISLESLYLVPADKVHFQSVVRQLRYSDCQEMEASTSWHAEKAAARAFARSSFRWALMHEDSCIALGGIRHYSPRDIQALHCGQGAPSNRLIADVTKASLHLQSHDAQENEAQYARNAKKVIQNTGKTVELLAPQGVSSCAHQELCAVHSEKASPFFPLGAVWLYGTSALSQAWRFMARCVPCLAARTAHLCLCRINVIPAHTLRTYPAIQHWLERCGFSFASPMQAPNSSEILHPFIGIESSSLPPFRTCCYRQSMRCHIVDAQVDVRCGY